MNDHNLDDLIIDNIQPKNAKTKSLLTIVALLIVILIVAIILTKIILKDPKTDQIAMEKDNTTEMISPELTLQNATKKEEVKKEEAKLSTIMDSEPKAPIDTPIKAPEVKKVEDTKKEEIVAEKIEEIKPIEEVKPTEEIKPVVKSEPAKEAVKITEEFAQKPISTPETKPAVKETVKKAAKVKKEEPEVIELNPTPRNLTEKAKIKPAGRPANAPKNTQGKTGKYFIQVGSFAKSPSSRFLGIIKKSGFQYTITPPNAGGTKKLLIGPYPDRSVADNALVRVKDRINKSAFVIKK